MAKDALGHGSDSRGSGGKSPSEGNSVRARLLRGRTGDYAAARMAAAQNAKAAATIAQDHPKAVGAPVNSATPVSGTERSNPAPGWTKRTFPSMTDADLHAAIQNPGQFTTPERHAMMKTEYAARQAGISKQFVTPQNDGRGGSGVTFRPVNKLGRQ